MTVNEKFADLVALLTNHKERYFAGAVSEFIAYRFRVAEALMFRNEASTLESIADEIGDNMPELAGAFASAKLRSIHCAEQVEAEVEQLGAALCSLIDEIVPLYRET